MNIENLNSDDALLHMERYCGEGTRSYSNVSEVNEADPDHQPESESDSFCINIVTVPRDRVAIFQADSDPALLDHYVGRSHIRFAVHSEVWADSSVSGISELHLFPNIEKVRVSATASTRTVFRYPDRDGLPAHYLKLHFPRRISRFSRRLRRLNVRNSIAISNDLASFSSEKFAWLAETIGITFGNTHESWGFIVRQAIPTPARTSSRLIPAFALYGGDALYPQDPPILIQLIEKFGGSPEEFITREILLPVIHNWVRVTRERGILLESHAQNTVLEVDENLRPRRIVYRDFDVWIDREVRSHAGLPDPFEGGVHQMEGSSRQHHYSLIYDHFIGREFFDYVLECAARFYPIDMESVRRLVREEFRRAFPDFDQYFPTDTTYYFSEDEGSEHQVPLVDQKQAPVWR